MLGTSRRGEGVERRQEPTESEETWAAGASVPACDVSASCATSQSRGKSRGPPDSELSADKTVAKVSGGDDVGSS